jgi:hypothetical protein
MVGVGEIVAVCVSVGGVVWVAVWVEVAVGTGEGEGEFVGVNVGVNDTVGTRVWTGVDSALQPDINISSGAIIKINFFIPGR